MKSPFLLKIFAVLAAVYLTPVHAQVNEANAAKALDAMVADMDFSAAPGAPQMPNLARFGGPKNEVLANKWSTRFDEKFEGEAWTVFVANATVSTYYGKYKVKVGVALQQKGDETFMRHAFEPAYEQVVPSVEDIAELKKAAERAYLLDKVIEKVYKRGWDIPTMYLSNGSSVISEIDPSPFTSSVFSQQFNPFILTFKTKLVSEFKERNGTPIEILMRFKEHQLAELMAQFERFKEWAKTAKGASVEAFSKSLEDIGNPHSDMRPGASLLFEFDALKNARLKLSSYGSEITLSEDDVNKLSEFIAKIESKHLELKAQVGPEVELLMQAKAKQDNLFK